MSYRIEALAAGHDLDAFRSGQLDLDAWLHQHARLASRQGTRVSVLVDDESHAVVGYFAVAPHLLRRMDAPARVARGAPGLIPAILLAKLALAEDLHGTGLGRELLVRALRTIVTAAQTGGGRLIVVDAIDDRAAAFYRANDFQPTPTDAGRLVMRLSTAARALGLFWP